MEGGYKKIPEYFWFGSGPDTLSFLAIEPFTRFDEVLNILIVSDIDNAHNEFLNILINQGFFAMFFYIIGLILSIIKCNFSKNSCAIASGGVVFYLIQSFFGISTYISAPFFWLSLAFLNQKNGENLEKRKGKK